MPSGCSGGAGRAAVAGPRRPAALRGRLLRPRPRTGNTATSLLILGPISMFALPAVAMIAFWWNDWPGSRLTTPWTGLIDTALIVAGGGRAHHRRPGHRRAPRHPRGVRGHPRPRRRRRRFPRRWRWPAPSSPRCSSCRWSASAGRWPASAGSGPASPRWRSPGRSGSAPTSCSSTSTPCPPPNAPPPGCATPAAPSPAPDFGSRSSPSGVWQAVFFIVLRGWPVNLDQPAPVRLLGRQRPRHRPRRATYLVLRDLAHLSPGAISAACGCVISAALIVGMLFEGWPAARLPTAPGRALTLVLTAAVARRAQPRPGRLRRRRALGKGHPGRLGDHRRAQLHRRRHHPARRHRSPLAVVGDHSRGTARSNGPHPRYPLTAARTQVTLSRARTTGRAPPRATGCCRLGRGLPRGARRCRRFPRARARCRARPAGPGCRRGRSRRA